MGLDLSIITINYNNQKGLVSTMQSVAEQTFKNFEYIVIDGGSTDGSQNAINLYSTIISHSISEKDNGIYDAMNKGIQNSAGKYLLFLNSGDCLNGVNALENVLPLMTGGKDIIACSYKMEGSNIVEESPQEASFSSFWYKSICHQAVLIKKDLFTKYGLYDTSLKVVADWEFFVRTIFLQHASYQPAKNVLSIIENNGLSSNIDGYQLAQEERSKVYRKLFPGFIKDFEKLKRYENSGLHKLVTKVRKGLKK
jgi:glycosyltransferase involved in cell wall biosynthesis